MKSILIILIIFAGYFVLLDLILKRSERRQSVIATAMVVLLIYGCAVGMVLTLGQYLGELGLLFYAFAVIYSCFYWGWRTYRVIREKTEVHWGMVVVLITYLLAVLYVTTFMREGGTEFRVQMDIFNWIANDGGTEKGELFNHMILNVAMFVPVGVIIPFTADVKKGTFLSAASFGMLVSVIIETGQLIFHYGMCDIDDILANTLGTLIGVVIITLWMKKKV